MVTSMSEAMFSGLVEQIRRGEIETEPYMGGSWLNAQAAPGQPFPDDSDPEEPSEPPK